MKWILLPLLWTLSAQGEAFRFQRGKIRFELRVTTHAHNSPATFEDHELRYQVLRAGKRLLTASRGAGTLRGCKIGRPIPRPVPTVVEAGGVAYGWLLSTGGICGNTYSLRTHLIVPSEKEPDRFYFREFVPKVAPLMEGDSTKARIHYAYQEWGRGGTAAAFFVPHTLAVDLNALAPIADAPVGPDPEQWPTFQGVSYALPSYVLAGINHFDARLVRAAATRLDKSSTEHLKTVGLPHTKEELRRLAEGLELAGPAVQEFHRVLRYSPYPR